MNKSIFKSRIAVLFIALGLSFTSCSDDDSGTSNPDTQNISTEEISKALEVEQASTFINDMTLSNIAGTKSEFAKNNDCIDYVVSESGYTLTFNDCEFPGRGTVSGTINVVVTIANDQATSTVTFDNFTYNGNVVNGSKTTSYSLNSNGGSFVYNVTSDISIAFADGTTAFEQGTKTYEVTGLGTAEAAYSITGNWTVGLDNNTYSFVTDPSISGDFNCQYFTTGAVDITHNGNMVSVDFGDGSCDNKATVIYPDGTEVEIEL